MDNNDIRRRMYHGRMNHFNGNVFGRIEGIGWGIGGHFKRGGGMKGRRGRGRYPYDIRRRVGQGQMMIIMIDSSSGFGL